MHTNKNSVDCFVSKVTPVIQVVRITPTAVRTGDSSEINENVLIVVHWKHAPSDHCWQYPESNPTPRERWVVEETFADILSIKSRLLVIIFQNGQHNLLFYEFVGWAPRQHDWCMVFFRYSLIHLRIKVIKKNAWNPVILERQSGKKLNSSKRYTVY